jgi:hypothetical protein
LYLRVTISRYVDAAFPGWVECSMVDALGHEHLFVDKVPIVTEASLNETSHYPQPGYIACIVIGRNQHDDGSQRVRIDTQRPWSMETTEGRSIFEVFTAQLTELPREEAAL